MTSEVQRLIDLLGSRLQRSVVLNDPDVRLLYASQHYGDEDDVRVRAALYRDAGSRAIAHVLAQGVHRGSTPGRIPAAPDIGMLARLLVPVRWHGELLGSVVIIDADHSLTEPEIALVQDLARTVAGLTVAERHAANLQVVANEQDVAAWLSSDPTARAAGRRGLIGRGVLPDLDRVRVIAAQATPEVQIDETLAQLALRHAFGAVQGPLRGTALASLEAARGTFAFLSSADITDESAGDVADKLLREYRDFLGREHCVRIGIGTQVHRAEDAWLSRRQADLSLRAVAIRGAGPIAHWTDLGALQVLTRIPPGELDATAIPEPVVALLEADPQGRLVETLEAYLDRGGAGQATAKALHVHRTTLYYRLDRVREITGVDIDDGQIRLMLHLGLAMRRLHQHS